MMKRRTIDIAVALVCCLFFQACSMSKLAAKAAAGRLTGKGASNVFTSDSDPALVGEALPFAIKMYESLLQANPKHPGLLETTGSLFIMYANAFVQGPAEFLPGDRYLERQAETARAGKLYFRGLELLYRGLALRHPAFNGFFQNNKAGSPVQNLPEALAKMKKSDVPLLYWAGAGGLSAFSLNPFDPGLGLKISEFLAFIKLAYELDPDYNKGALDEALFLYYASVPEILGGDKAKAEEHYRRALEKSGGNNAGVFVSYAKAVSIPNQDYDTFKATLETALSIDIDADPSQRLVNVISQQKAQHLLDSANQLFIFLGADDYDDEEW
ncbi:MAG: TRAP transporter TatT component family protein [Treponema sp.]|nr:TRAP transporter TatT component family protein [Treponema sp.]